MGSGLKIHEIKALFSYMINEREQAILNDFDEKLRAATLSTSLSVISHK